MDRYSDGGMVICGMGAAAFYIIMIVYGCAWVSYLRTGETPNWAQRAGIEFVDVQEVNK